MYRNVVKLITKNIDTKANVKVQKIIRRKVNVIFIHFKQKGNPLYSNKKIFHHQVI